MRHRLILTALAIAFAALACNDGHRCHSPVVGADPCTIETVAFKCVDHHAEPTGTCDDACTGAVPPECSGDHSVSVCPCDGSPCTSE